MRPGPTRRGGRRRRHPPRPRLLRPAGVPHAGVVHAPGRAGAPRVPDGPWRRLHPLGHLGRAVGGGADTATGPALRGGRGDPVLGHRGPAPRRGLRRRDRSRPWTGRGGPFRGEDDLDRLRPFVPEADAPYVAEAAQVVAAELAGTGVALIGFAGAPFTVASYMVEGGPSRTFARVKALMHSAPDLWDRLVARLADMAVASLRAQILAGAQAFQLFDSWAAALPRRVPASPCRAPAPCSRGWPISACRASSSGSGPGSSWRSWAAPGPTWWAWTGGPPRRGSSSGGPGPLGAGEPRPGHLPGPVAGGRGGDAGGAVGGRGLGLGSGGAGPRRRQRERRRARLQPRARRAARDRPGDPARRRRPGAPRDARP